MTKKHIDSFSFCCFSCDLRKKEKRHQACFFFFKYKEPANHYSIQTILRFS